MRNVLVDYGRHFELSELAVHNNGDFLTNETEILLTRIIRKLVGEIGNSIEEARDTKSCFCCEVLLAFQEDMNGMKALYKDMKARGDEGVFISQYKTSSMTFYLPCLECEHGNTDADNGANGFLR